MININYRDPRPIYEQVKEGFRHLILSQVLQADDKMPSVRELATGLAINPNTIQRAYKDLETEGYICSVPGKGSFVCDRSRVLDNRKQELLAEFKTLADELAALGMSRDELAELVRGGNESDRG
ncbi:MAG: GntR family transcriptional regulator [Oscillospiraceae bacterium]|nr:GntR family transcriptional regulator [Oscillospiraceae bacterium]